MERIISSIYLEKCLYVVRLDNVFERVYKSKGNFEVRVLGGIHTKSTLNQNSSLKVLAIKELNEYSL